MAGLAKAGLAHRRDVFCLNRGWLRKSRFARRKWDVRRQFIFRPSGARFLFALYTHGLRRGLHSVAASRLRLSQNMTLLHSVLHIRSGNPIAICTLRAILSITLSDNFRSLTLASCRLVWRTVVIFSAWMVEGSDDPGSPGANGMCVGGSSFAPPGLVLCLPSTPTACAVGCILSLLRSWLCARLGRRHFRFPI